MNEIRDLTDQAGPPDSIAQLVACKSTKFTLVFGVE